MGNSGAGFSSQINFDVYGNPAYTIKDGGTLKRKPQPYAADRVGRDGLNIDRERLEQTTGPGSYNLGTGPGAAKPP